LYIYIYVDTLCCIYRVVDGGPVFREFSVICDVYVYELVYIYIYVYTYVCIYICSYTHG